MRDPAITTIELDELGARDQKRLLSTIVNATGRTEPFVIISRSIGECTMIMPADWSEERQLAWVASNRSRLEAITGKPWQTLERM